MIEEFRKWLEAILRWTPGRAGEKLRARFYEARHGCTKLTILDGVVIAGKVTFGSGVTLGRNVTIESPHGETVIGDNVSINHGAWICANEGKITIGSNTLIGPYAVVRAANHNYEADALIASQGHTPGEVVIGSNVWLSSNVTVLPAATIGDNSVIAAGAVVRKEIPPNALAGGVPAKIIRQN